MTEYTIYPRDIWDYIIDLPYMPSKEDREKLFRNLETRDRIQLWDYFFRIRPEDVGIPQQNEISIIRGEILLDAIKYNETKEKQIINQS